MTTVSPHREHAASPMDTYPVTEKEADDKTGQSADMQKEQSESSHSSGNSDSSVSHCPTGARNKLETLRIRQREKAERKIASSRSTSSPISTADDSFWLPPRRCRAKVSYVDCEQDDEDEEEKLDNTVKLPVSTVRDDEVWKPRTLTTTRHRTRQATGRGKRPAQKGRVANPDTFSHPDDVEALTTDELNRLDKLVLLEAHEVDRACKLITIPPLPTQDGTRKWKTAGASTKKKKKKKPAKKKQSKFRQNTAMKKLAVKSIIKRHGKVLPHRVPRNLKKKKEPVGEQPLPKHEKDCPPASDDPKQVEQEIPPPPLVQECSLF